MNMGIAEVNLAVMPLVNKVLSPETRVEERLIRDYDTLRSIATILRAMGKRIVLTKGTYDLIHVGHARYIREARQHGDVLIVSADTDALTRERKGPNRPIVHEDERFEMLLHLRYVDIVTVRDITNDMEEDIDVIRPHVLITSSTTADYRDDTKRRLEEQYGLQVITLDAQAETSTTARVRRLMIDGAEELAREVQGLVQGFIRKLKGD